MLIAVLVGLVLVLVGTGALRVLRGRGPAGHARDLPRDRSTGTSPAPQATPRGRGPWSRFGSDY